MPAPPTRHEFDAMTTAPDQQTFARAVLDSLPAQIAALLEYSRIERRGGAVWIDGGEGRGATFRFTWPKLKAGKGFSRSCSVEDRGLNILLVEDDEIDVMNVRRALKTNRITSPLYVAGNGAEALAILRGASGDPPMPRARRIVLLDLNMPRMNGIEFLRALRDDPDLRGTTVIVLTTSDEERDKIDAYRLNVAGYIVKPVTMAAFVEVMATLNRYWTVSELP